MTAQSTTSNEAALQDKITFQLSLYANLINGEENDGNLEHLLQQRIQDNLDINRGVIGGWEIVWGPGIEVFPTDLYARNVLYMVRSTDDPSRYVIAVAGSTDGPFDWLVENFLIGQIPWLAYPAARYTTGAAIGVNILSKITPSGDRPGAGRTLHAFLGALDHTDIDLTVTGHSLAGVLSPTLALLLRDTQQLWDPSEKARVSVLSTAGPSFGNPEFVAYATQRLQRVRRYANSLDVIPNVWNPDDIDRAKTFYSDNNLPAPWPGLFDLIKQASNSGQYAHLDSTNGVFQGTFNTEVTDYLKQVGYQHIGGYRQFFEIPGVSWPVAIPAGVGDTGIGRIAALAGGPLGDGIGKAPENRRPLTAPINGQPVELPTDPDSREAGKLVDLVTAEIDPTADVS
ncbi:lipase (class 3) [Nocardia bhagyanarayanae]|uniref:Lipase (Class 3) n=2 Tax=Nocardia bhagyanarayanae TaxID=1215925 RepID=A0A543FHA8_9NOCA|nr:lipase (class 3) [Nocardia bhagyanarayanae]